MAAKARKKILCVPLRPLRLKICCETESLLYQSQISAASRRRRFSAQGFVRIMKPVGSRISRHQ